MTTPKKLSELDPRQVVAGNVVRLRDGESPHAIRGNDLDAWAKLIADKRDGDRFYLVPRIEFLPLRPTPIFRPMKDKDDGAWARYAYGYGVAAIPADPLLRIRRLRDEFAIELDTHRVPSDALEPIDDPADRYALIELDKEGA